MFVHAVAFTCEKADDLLFSDVLLLVLGMNTGVGRSGGKVNVTF